MGVNLLVNTALFAKLLDQRSLDKAVCPSGLAAKHSLKELFLLLRRFLEEEPTALKKFLTQKQNSRMLRLFPKLVKS